MTEGSVMTASATASTCRTDPTSLFDTWLLQKLRLEWSSCDFGSLLTPSKLAEARVSFPHLETPIKVRLLLSLLSVRQDEVDVTGVTGHKEVNALLVLAEQDTEEWVRVSGGMVKQFLMLQADGRPADSYLHTQLEAAVAKVVQIVISSSLTRRSDSTSVALDDYFSLENGLLNPSLRPALTLTAATHFTINGEDDDGNGKEDEVSASPMKKPLHRPHMARPLGSSGAATSSTTATTTSGLTRLTPSAVKPPVGKKHMATLSSEIRRKADAGRFKRQRSRISMIDINEVKQIKTEKAQKAEERKKQKLAAKEKEKEKAKEKEKMDAAVINVAIGSEVKGGATDIIAPSISVKDEHAAIAADIFAMHQQASLDDSTQQYSQQQLPTGNSIERAEVTPVAGNGTDYVPDGTQALLNAAFHSTQDIMKEVVSQQNHQMQGQHQMQHQQLQQPTYQDLYRAQQQMQMHHLAPPPQQQYHQGFESEDTSITNANAGGISMGFGGYNYGTTAGYYGDQFGNYGAPQDMNAFSAAGYPTSAMGQPDSGINGVGLPPLGGRQLGFDPTLQQQHPQQNNGGYMGGSGEYWR